MKIAVIGSGNVGMATFRQLQDMPEVTEIVLCGRDGKNAKMLAEIDDYLDAQVLKTPPTPKLSYGGYEKTAGADIIIYTAGAAQKPGQSRLELVETNVNIVRTVFSEIDKYNPAAIVICLANPVDVITAAVVKYTNRPAERVIGSGTLLDTARLRKYVSSMLDVSSESIDAFVLGEHGDSSCPVWSSVRVLGMTLQEYMSLEVGDDVELSEMMIANIVRKTATKLIEAKGYTAYGVAAAACKIVRAIVHDTHEILPLSYMCSGEMGVDGFAISVPCLIGQGGIIAVKKMAMTDSEREMFEKSCCIVSDTAKSVGI